MNFLILLVAVLSTAQILRLYFSYEDFSLLYGLQFPDDEHIIFKLPGVVAYLSSRPLLTPQFLIFGYNPFPYYLVSIGLFLITLWLFYCFAKSVYPKNIAQTSTLIMASGYVGIEALTWNVASGQTQLAFVEISLLTLFFANRYLNKKKRKIKDLFCAILTLIVGVYFFQSRSYLLLVWLPLLIFLNRKSGQKLQWKLYIVLTISIALLSLMFAKSIQLIFGRITHLNLDFAILLQTYLKNLANLFFPSDLVDSIISLLSRTPFTTPDINTIIGVLVLLGLAIPPLYLIKQKRKIGWITAFFSISILVSLLVIMLVIAFTGQVPTVWPTSHRFYVVLLPFISGYLALLLSNLRKNLQLFGLFIISSSHIYFSNYTILNRLEAHSKHLRYFYESVTKEAPHIDKSDILLTTLTRPFPPGPFVSGSDAGSAHFLAGFYGKRFDDFNLATEPLEAVKLLLDKNLTPDDIYAFDYKRDDVVNETGVVRDILKKGRIINLGNNLSGAEIELTDLSISSAAPVFIKADVGVELSQKSMDAKSFQDGTMSLSQYFGLLFEQEEKRTKIVSISAAISLRDEHSVNNVVDGKYETTWIPQNWNKEGSLTVDLGDSREIYLIVWASSRTAPWDFRQPSDYELAISNDGGNFTNVEKVTDAPKLETGQFFKTDIGGKEAKFIKLTINKTRGGWTPAVDEVEVFDRPISEADLKNYFTVKQNPSSYFPDQNTMLTYWRQILKQRIPVEINWKVDGDGGYLSGQEKKIYVEGMDIIGEYLVSLPKTGRRIKSVRLKATDFPSQLIVNKLEVWQPSLAEFRSDKKFLDY